MKKQATEWGCGNRCLQGSFVFRKNIIKLSAEDIDVLVNRIYEYTVELAHNNNYDLAETEMLGEDNPIINLRHYLNIQNNIFDTAA